MSWIGYKPPLGQLRWSPSPAKAEEDGSRQLDQTPKGGGTMREEKTGLREFLGRSPRLIAGVALLAWLAMLWFMFSDVL